MNELESVLDLEEAEFSAGSRPLTENQQIAVETLLARCREGQHLISLDGAAGTGKTTLLSGLVGSLTGSSVAVVTPTNKAATVLVSKGIDAATLFARFFTLVEVNERSRKMVFVPNDERGKLSPGKIDYASVIIVDEASMLTHWALRHLQRMCDTLILVGDSNQLPPVNDRDTPRGYFCTRTHDVTLTEVLRNRGEVLKLATAVRTSADGRALKGVRTDDYYPVCDFETLFMLDSPQIVCWRNVVRRAMNARVRGLLGRTSVLPVSGDLMLCRNNYSDRLLNGTQAALVSFEWDGESFLAKAQLDVGDAREMADVNMRSFFEDQLPAHTRDFTRWRVRNRHTDDEGAELTYGYAITAHSAQGGEWPTVVVVDERAGIHGISAKTFMQSPANVPPDDACRRWFYTAVTRAREKVYVADERWTKY